MADADGCLDAARVVMAGCMGSTRLIYHQPRGHHGERCRDAAAAVGRRAG